VGAGLISSELSGAASVAATAASAPARFAPNAGLTQIFNLYDLQYQYMNTDGIDFATFSLDRLLPAKDGKAVFSVTIPSAWDINKPCVAVAADIVADGKYLGQIAEGVVDVEFA
jgi:hypothetical protein